jgi:hypothetical protein
LKVRASFHGPPPPASRVADVKPLAIALVGRLENVDISTPAIGE